MKVKVWKEKVIIPTYEIGKPEKNPIFLEKRVYQGSSGAVYPHPVIEKISDEVREKEWQACFLENEYLKIMILPELGGRVQMAFDKTKNRHFVYYNEVIKPALVGLTGPWISGGIEFNWPQHHRPSTYDPVDFTIEENADGSKTVWCSEIERMFRTRGMTGFTLHPQHAYLEIKVRLYNRTSQAQTFLWWANPAVAVNEHYQSVFPPDVNAVFDHGKRDVSTFPVATGTYYKMDYSSGVDISKYKNIPVPTSYMAIESKYDFVGGFENDSQGGLLHVANHHVSPGKKQWTWGNGDFGEAWDRNLTDRNGPYIELMCGVYTDNQPDFSWLMPYEEKSFSQYFMPYRDIGVVKNATKDIMLNLEITKEKAHVKIFTTGIFKDSRIILTGGGKGFLDTQHSFTPETSYSNILEIDADIADQDYHLEVLDNSGNLLIHWSPEGENPESIPEAAVAALLPEEIKSVEELYLNGLHLEQYRHATYDPTAYYREGLMRDPGDIRCNNALGLWLFRRGKFAQAASHFQTAISTLTKRNPNPYDGEPLFNMGLSLRLQGKDADAYRYFHKSVWNAAYMDSGYFQIAQIDVAENNWTLALENVDRSLNRNWTNHKARHLKAAILRNLSENDQALILCEGSLALDPFNFGVLYEKHLLNDLSALDEFTSLLRGNIHNYIEIALDYAWAGLHQEAVSVLDLGIKLQENAYPMAYYYKAWILNRGGLTMEAKQAILSAEECLPDYCFPHQLESVLALQLAIELNPTGSKAPYYLGNFWYNARQYDEALSCFEKSAELNDTFSIVFRNLALAYFNKFDQEEKALACMEKADELAPNDARLLMELNQLYKKTNRSIDFRFDLLQKKKELVIERDDLYLERVELYLLKEDYKSAYEMVMRRNFHPWEGGEGKVSGAYVRSLLGLARLAIECKDFQGAIHFLEKLRSFPHNLGEGKLVGTQENRMNYWLGCAYEGLGETEKARSAWKEASSGINEPVMAWYYNDQQPDILYFQGITLLKLGESKAAMICFDNLIEFGEKHADDEVKIEYFAVSLPDLQIWEDDLSLRNKNQCHYLMGLGYKGKGEFGRANKYFQKVLKNDPAHAGARENAG